MQQKFFTQPPQPIFIMLSGLPCTGKSTWRSHMLNKLNELKIPVQVISADDMAFQMCDESQSENKLTYELIFSSAQYRSVLEQRCQDALRASQKQNGGFVILDRTYLTVDKRAAAFKVLSNHKVHIVTFDIHDPLNWKTRLSQRNSENPDKNITPEIIAGLKNGATPPTKSEGFASVIPCCAVGEPDWETRFTNSITTLISLHNTKQSQLVAENFAL